MFLSADRIIEGLTFVLATAAFGMGSIKSILEGYPLPRLIGHSCGESEHPACLALWAWRVEAIASLATHPSYPTQRCIILLHLRPRDRFRSSSPSLKPWKSNRKHFNVLSLQSFSLASAIRSKTRSLPSLPVQLYLTSSDR
jgi:hypothetical protein